MPTSAILVNGKRLNYYQFIKSNEYRECKDAIKRIGPKIDLDKINELIDSVELLSELQKEFLKKILRLRKEIIIDQAL